MEKKWPTAIIIGAVIVLVASFMPWGTFTSTLKPTVTGGPFEGLNSFKDVQATITLSGWNGWINLFTVKIPNWIVVIAAAAVLGLALMEARTDIIPNPIMSVVLSAYGTFHVGFVMYILVPKGSLGIGSILTFGAFVVFLGYALQNLVFGAAKAEPVSR